MKATAGAHPLAVNAPPCPQCGRAMEPCSFEGHYGQQVDTDLCPHCHLVWFDAFESVRLSGLGWVGLLRRMQAAMAEHAGPMKPQLHCLRCPAPLQPVHNLTRFGRFAALECQRKHGHLQTFALLLAERGLVRPLGHLDLKALTKEARTPCCFNCGAPIEQLAEECSHCASPLVVVDMPRLLAALLVRHAEPLPAESADRIAWPCRGCGAPLAPTETERCDRCHHPVVVPSVLDLRPVLDQAEPLLRGMQPRQARPHGDKLKAMLKDPSTTMTHRFGRHVMDIFSDGRSAGGTSRWDWIALALLSAAIWYLWG